MFVVLAAIICEALAIPVQARAETPLEVVPRLSGREPVSPASLGGHLHFTAHA
jgi:hypothetical protein